MKNVLIIITGGTICMSVDATSNSLAPQKNVVVNELKEMISKRKEGEFPFIEFVETEEQIDSADISLDNWKEIAGLVQKNYERFDGFVIIMGTDTLAYTASAFSFMFENLSKTVVLTGSMLPLFRVGETDAPRNLIVSILIAAYSNICEVCVYFYDKVYRGNRIKKIDSISLQAFASPNFPPLATASTDITIHKNLLFNNTTDSQQLNNDNSARFSVFTDFETNILAIRLIPGFNENVIISLLQEMIQNPSNAIRAVIFEIYGAGNAPKKSRLIECIRKLTEKKILVVVTSQCLRGHVDLEMYATGKNLLEAGAVSALDMTFESTSMKLSYLFGKKRYDVDRIKELMSQSLRGEITTTNLKTEPRFNKNILVFKETSKY